MNQPYKTYDWPKVHKQAILTTLNNFGHRLGACIWKHEKKSLTDECERILAAGNGEAFAKMLDVEIDYENRRPRKKRA